MRHLTLSLLIAFFVFSCSEPPANTTSDNVPPATNDSIATGSAAAAGMDTVMLKKLETEITSGIYPNIHSLLIAHDNKLLACVGNGDQRIFFNREKKLVVVVNAGNYNKWDIPKNSHHMLYTYIYPSLK